MNFTPDYELLITYLRTTKININMEFTLMDDSLNVNIINSFKSNAEGHNGSTINVFNYGLSVALPMITYKINIAIVHTVVPEL